MYAHARFVWPVAFAALLLLLGACDASFEPYEETDQTFSLFGILDPTDEQQRVRVEVLQDGKPFGADSVIDAVVTLERVETGRTVTLIGERLAVRGLKHNFRTGEMDVRLDETYRLAVRRAGAEGHATTVTTTTPHEVPALLLSEQGLRATVEGGTEDQLLFLSVDYHTTIREPPGCAGSDGFNCRVYRKTFELQYAERARRTDTGYTAAFDWEADIDSLWAGDEAAVYLRRVDVQVGLVHPSAPTYDGLSREELFSPGAAPTNVERGVGLVLGATTDTALVRIPAHRRPVTVVP